MVSVSYNLVNTSWEVDKTALDTYVDPPQDPQAIAALYPEERIESDHPEIIALARSIIGDEENPYVRAELLYAWVNRNLTYDEDQRYAHQGAYAALLNRRGVCTEYAALLVALLRASGIPARLVGGYYFEETAKDDHDAELVGGVTAHTWAEFYLEGYGWIPCEPTYEYIESEIYDYSQKYFAALPHWGHVVASYGLGRMGFDRQFDVTYSGYRDMLSGMISPKFQHGQRLMDEEIKVFLGSLHQRIVFGDQQPTILATGVTMVPMRRIYEILGATVVWDEEQQKITALHRDNVLELEIGVATLWLNGDPREIAEAPLIDPLTSRTLVPLRAVSEGLGSEVVWDAVQRSILIVP